MGYQQPTTTQHMGASRWRVETPPERLQVGQHKQVRPQEPPTRINITPDNGNTSQVLRPPAATAKTGIYARLSWIIYTLTLTSDPWPSRWTCTVELQDLCFCLYLSYSCRNSPPPSPILPLLSSLSNRAPHILHKVMILFGSLSPDLDVE